MKMYYKLCSSMWSCIIKMYIFITTSIIIAILIILQIANSTDGRNIEQRVYSIMDIVV